MRVNLGSVQRRDVHSHLVQAEDAPPNRRATSIKALTSRPMTDLSAPACSTRAWSMGEPLSSLDRSSTNVSLTMLDSVTGFIAGLLFDASRLDSVPIPWARKRGVDWRDSSNDGDPTRFDARGGEVASEGVRDDLPTRSSSIDRGRRRPGHAETTTTRDVEPKTGHWRGTVCQSRRHRLHAIPQAGAWTTREDRRHISR